ncbi:MAG: class II fumarate hydratase [Pseudomonadaceae bacterium]|nr:class II fumarate hydratase [Pseudomonadaceae bacterium]
MSTRTVKDSMGEIQVPADALYGAQTQRAIDNFAISGTPMPLAFIESLLMLKQAAALANMQLDLLESKPGSAIVQACEQLRGAEDLLSHFPVDVYQTGSGTSTNMNANEVIATLASRICGEDINPNDHVNLGQSSNDVIPSTIHVSAALAVNTQLLPGLERLHSQLTSKAAQIGHHVKTGRTHLMDAMPVTLGQVLGGWAAQIEADLKLLSSLLKAMQSLAIGGTAVGTGVNAHPEFAEKTCQELTTISGMQFAVTTNHFALIGAQDGAVALSGGLKTCAVSLMKIANDLRWMNSGPLAGLAEIELQPLQPGSSIMPGKVNPVIPEAAAMVAAQVISNDTAITIAGQSGNFELNVMLPLIANNLLSSIKLLGNVAPLLADKAIATFDVNEENLGASLQRNPILVTALNPVVGYMKAAEIAKQAYEQKRPVVEVAAELTDIPVAELRTLLDPAKLT